MQNNVTVVGGKLEEAEINNYIAYVKKKNPNRTIKSLRIEPDGEYVNLSYELEPVPFERIRRITGYLVGTMDRWNNAKRAEERDRVKHGI
ncbi:MAG: Anaerobic ribonucleoside-triphosphate reductase [Oscillospiraceae bacterium]|jgi:predicted SnoaL-like aldol condensation-catalyzing enzyme